MSEAFTLFAIVQAGRLSYEAVLLAASVARRSPQVSLVFAEPQPGPLWPEDPRIDAPVRTLLQSLGATIVPFEAQVFGAAYPYGNKIEALSCLPPDRPFVFLDTDTLVLDDLTEVPFDFERPSASLRRTGTWPKGDNIHAVWAALYARFGLDFAASQDPDCPLSHWERYLYFNAGYFYYRCPRVFGEMFLEVAREIWEQPGPALEGQKLSPWLDQIALPLVIHKLGGGRTALRPGYMDGATTCHYRSLSLLYAREAAAVSALLEEIAREQAIKKVLKDHLAVRKLVYQGKGNEARALGEELGADVDEAELRKALRAANLWFR